MSTPSLGTALITGASSGIGSVYADRLAKRGYDLILVARDQSRMEALAERLRKETGRAIEVVRADLTAHEDLQRVEARLAQDEKIVLLVNNAGAAAFGGFTDPNLGDQDRLIRLNVTAVTRLAGAVVPRFLAKGQGSIINIASVVALAPDRFVGIYPATKAFVLAFSQSLQSELGSHGVYVQAVLPAATRTEIWERSGRDINAIPGMMDADEMVDAALVGFDRREAITIPWLQDADQDKWDVFAAARGALAAVSRQEHAASRYRK
jgi:short-subunit dehydrogenase